MLTYDRHLKYQPKCGQTIKLRKKNMGKRVKCENKGGRVTLVRLQSNSKTSMYHRTMNVTSLES